MLHEIVWQTRGEAKCNRFSPLDVKFPFANVRRIEINVNGFQRTLKSMSHLRRTAYATFTTRSNVSAMVGIVDNIASAKFRIKTSLS